MALVIKDMTAFQRTEKIYSAYLKSANKEKLFQKYKSEITINKASLKSLKEKNVDLKTDIEGI